MPRYMIELPFTAEYCVKSMDKFDQRSADFLPQVFWGCSTSNTGQPGWAIVEADSPEKARETVPESLRDQVNVTEIKVLSPELIEAIQNKSIEKAA